MTLEMLCLLEPAVTDGTLSKDHDEAHGDSLQNMSHDVRRWIGKRSFDRGGEGFPGDRVSQLRG